MQGLWPGRRWADKEGTARAIHALGHLQLDPVSLVSRSHDLVLSSRVSGYRRDDLGTLVYQDRRFFEYGGHLDVYPIEEYPYWERHKARRRDEPRVRTFLTDHAALVDEVRVVVRDRGPVSARNLPDQTPVRSGRASSAAGLALYHLWLTGELMTHHREGFERIYDLTERIAPPTGDPVAEPAVRTHAAQEVLRRSALPTLREWSGGVGYRLFEPVGPKEAAAWMTDLIAAGIAVPVTVAGAHAARFVHAEYLALLDTLSRGAVPHEWATATGTDVEVTFLSPLDNVVAPRERLQELFGFECVWEIYKPAETRRWGAYTMPILYQDRLVGRMDPKLDRSTNVLKIQGLWIEEEGLQRDPAFRRAWQNGIERFARFHDAREVMGSLAP